MQRNSLTLERVITAARAKGYPVYEKGEFNLNTYGIRASERRANQFDDALVVFYKVSGKWQFFVYKATTDPGAYYLLNPMHPAGTAIVAAGFYPGVYALGHHKKNPALKQIGNLTVYRDKNRDLLLNLDPETLQIATPDCAINIHYSFGNGSLNTIGNGSAGCQVLAYGLKDPLYLHFLKHYGEASKHWPNRFSYGILDEAAL